MLSCSIWFSAPRFWTGGGRVYTTYAAVLNTTIHPKSRRRKPYAATQHLMLLMMGVYTRSMLSLEYINKITYVHQVGISLYFKRKIHGQTTFNLLTPNVNCSGHTAPLTSKVVFYIFIQQI